MLGQLIKFTFVGALATVVHMTIGSLLIQFGWHPLMANTCAFAIAFFLSFVGHLGFSFADQNTEFSQALFRFVMVGLLGFGLNQAILVVLIQIDITSETVSLLISTSCAAVLTFMLSKFWAFRTEAGVYSRFGPDLRPTRLTSAMTKKHGLQSNRLSLAICLAAAVFFTVLFLAFPQIDVQVSGWFGTTEGFALSNSAVFSSLRSLMFVLTDGVMYLVLLLLVVGTIAKQYKVLSTRFLAFCLTCYAIGPGLIVNGILKRSSGRVRPRDAEMFGGDGAFYPFLDFSGPCKSACSFVSGEASAIATVAAILLVAMVPRLQPSKRHIATFCIIIVAIVGSSLRVVMGAHYPSDVVFSWIIVFPLVLGLHSVFQISSSASLVRCRWFQLSSSAA